MNTRHRKLIIAYYINEEINRFYVKVLHQTHVSDKFGNASGGHDFRSDSDIRLISSGYPEVRDAALYVRGTDMSRWNRTVYRSFANKERLDRYVLSVKNAVELYNKKYNKNTVPIDELVIQTHLLEELENYAYL